MAKIDPNDKSHDVQKRFTPREGRKVCAVTKFERSVGTGFDDSDEITVGVVVLKDGAKADPKLDPPTDVGLSTRMKFMTNDRGLRWLALAARALKYNEPFDPSSDDDLGKVFSSNKGILAGGVVLTTGKNGKTYSDLRDLAPVDLVGLGLAVVVEGETELTEEVRDLCARGEADYDEMVARRAAKRAGGGGHGGGGSRGGSERHGDDGGEGIPF